LKIDDKSKSPKLDLETENRSEKSMEEIRFVTRAPVHPKINVIKPIRGQTLANLNKFSLKHQISFDKNLMSIRGVVTNKISLLDC